MDVTTMPERITAMLEAQGKTNELLRQVVIDMAVLREQHGGSREVLAELRAIAGQMELRVRAAELSMVQIPLMQQNHTALANRFNSIEPRVGALEVAAAGSAVVTGGVRDVWKYLFSAVVAAAVTILGYAAIAAQAAGH